MKYLTTILLAGAAMTALCQPALAQESDYANGIDRIELQSNIPPLMITIRNMAASTDPADRDLQVISDNPQFTVSGRMFCEVFGPGDYGRAEEMQASFGGTVFLHSTGAGTPVQTTFTYWGESQDYSGQYPAADFELVLEMDVPRQASNLVSFTWNPVDYVEYRMEQFIANNAGTAADFLRQDDVFNHQIRLNLVGHCLYNSGSGDKVRGGYERIAVPVNIFYQGDPDIRDVLTLVDAGGGMIAQPVPDRARRATATRGGQGQPPATNTRPARAPTRSGPQ
ncbi:hypothetical protein [Maricaulis sp.]|uniref:hypothetical protein n=1 Tax=Maricaulis sp. TaxID=1486257 RepID=UPI0026231170|nr:hypothetical protein [Maricaulis sp.]